MDTRISILTFPQRFDGDRLHLNILLVPRLSASWPGNPLLPVLENFPNAGDTTPAFADADLQFEVRALDGFGTFPASIPPSVKTAAPEAGGALPDARALFESLVAPGTGRFRLTAAAPRLAAPVKKDIFIQKYLPRTYRDAFLFTGVRTPDAKTDDSYHCSVKARKTLNPAFQRSPDEVNWGNVYAFCLRNPKLAEALGLIRHASFEVSGTLFEKGGFVYADLAPGSAYAAQAGADFDFLKRYAARIPALKPGKERQLFAAVLFPVLNAVPGPVVPKGNYDQAFIEAADYDDGFVKIVHGTQPVSQNLLAEDPDGITPVTDIGIRLGWDDEQILIWQNRQMKEDPTVPKVPGQLQRLDAPMGVFGYRVDARQHPDANWHSLVRVRSKGQLAIDGVSLGEIAGELPVEVHPMQLDGYQETSLFWLPAYFCQWNGGSLVLPDEDAANLFKTEQDKNQAANLGRQYDAIGLDEIPLRYGKTYDFRVRLMDATGGGPTGELPPVPDQPPSFTTIPFRRHVVPAPVAIADAPLDNALYAPDTLRVDRPALGYPAVIFTGKYANPLPLLQAASDAAVGKGSFGIPDPDVTRVRIEVEVRTLRMDNLESLSGREPYIHYYTTHRDFPAGFDETCEIPLDYRDIAVLNFGDAGDLGGGLTQASIDAMAELPLPSARDVRLTLRAVANQDLGYFAGRANIGKPLQIKVRRESKDESGLLASSKIRGIFLQPDPAPAWDGTLQTLLMQRTTGSNPAMIDRLAHEIDVEHHGLTLAGRKGERVVFGCSKRIRHSLAPDHSSLTFAAKEDLANHWLVALTLDLGRDWTWDNLEPVSFEIFRKKRFQSDVETDDGGGKPVGDLEMIPTASMLALQNPRRRHTTLIYLDAIEPKSELTQAAHPAETRFPDVIEVDYDLRPRFATAPAAEDGPDEFRLHLDLPVTVPPAQVPRIASAGLALSKYARSADYSATEARRKYLWLEFAEPIRDPHDEYFVRFLGYSPDPLLSDNRLETFTPPEETALAIDPEPIRVIAPGATDDHAGLGAMTSLQPAGNSKVHYLVPLPPGLNGDSGELFGFFTYELRVGHAGIWSTAHGRWGRPLRATGVQHPAPTLFCTCERTEAKLIVEAPYAIAVLNGKNVTHNPPRTELWALLYAQVRQADGKDYRNILLDDRKLTLRKRLGGRFGKKLGIGFENTDSPARAALSWSTEEILEALRSLGLPADSPLSVLCVEMMPTLGALRVGEPSNRAGSANLAGSYVADQAGFGDAAVTGEGDELHPLSDALGHYRILRTSPLIPVPAVCCVDCV